MLFLRLNNLESVHCALCASQFSIGLGRTRGLGTRSLFVELGHSEVLDCIFCPFTLSLLSLSITRSRLPLVPRFFPLARSFVPLSFSLSFVAISTSHLLGCVENDFFFDSTSVEERRKQKGRREWGMGVIMKMILYL